MKQVICCIAVLLCFGCSADPLEIKEGITQPDISAVADGTYRGRAFIFPVWVETEVDILSGSITEIRLLRHFNGQGSAAEAIIDEVAAHQSLDVDVITGATQSSITILKSLEAALKEAAHDH